MVKKMNSKNSNQIEREPNNAVIAQENSVPETRQQIYNKSHLAQVRLCNTNCYKKREARNVAAGMPSRVRRAKSNDVSTYQQNARSYYKELLIHKKLFQNRIFASEKAVAKQIFVWIQGYKKIRAMHAVEVLAAPDSKDYASSLVVNGCRNGQFQEKTQTYTGCPLTQKRMALVELMVLDYVHKNEFDSDEGHRVVPIKEMKKNETEIKKKQREIDSKVKRIEFLKAKVEKLTFKKIQDGCQGCLEHCLNHLFEEDNCENEAFLDHLEIPEAIPEAIPGALLDNPSTKAASITSHPGIGDEVVDRFESPKDTEMLEDPQIQDIYNLYFKQPKLTEVQHEDTKNSLEARVKVLRKEIEALKKQNEAMASCESQVSEKQEDPSDMEEAIQYHEKMLENDISDVKDPKHSKRFDRLLLWDPWAVERPLPKKTFKQWAVTRKKWTLTQKLEYLIGVQAFIHCVENLSVVEDPKHSERFEAMVSCESWEDLSDMEEAIQYYEKALEKDLSDVKDQTLNEDPYYDSSGTLETPMSDPVFQTYRKKQKKPFVLPTFGSAEFQSGGKVEAPRVGEITETMTSFQNTLVEKVKYLRAWEPFNQAVEDLCGEEDLENHTKRFEDRLLYRVSPLVRVANIKKATDLPKLIEGLKKLSQPDPLVSEAPATNFILQTPAPANEAPVTEAPVTETPAIETTAPDFQTPQPVPRRRLRSFTKSRQTNKRDKLINFVFQNKLENKRLESSENRKLAKALAILKKGDGSKQWAGGQKVLNDVDY